MTRGAKNNMKTKKLLLLKKEIDITCKKLYKLLSKLYKAPVK